ncbi:heparan-alpha-glucosaminide N-acetyltransferase domain-containing protein [Amycolatopsis suaedae]|uniref:DUF1624 domain-containing protein n=1 Tax=Amycolatopsis suaedae TaxID=2510978 RepID=A0A4Q7J6E5_9PSEU|nr:heparan-alpha-glucosaminide N-acetyltransferase domain-containing protein [Amycolatopsis suaedae]RZQ62332.1 DUF1624 domain-containing protein [Amycolatopsis suaedae]
MTRGPRLAAVDAARGIALLGMIAVHSLAEESAPGEPTTAFAVFGGRAAATFAVLAGLGIAFMTGRRRVRTADFRATAAMLAVRALAIGAIGLALGYTDARFATVILPYYAVLFVLAIPLVLLPSWAVAAVGVAVAAGVPLLTHHLLPLLPAPSLDNHGFADAVAHPVRLLTELTLTGEYPALAWTTYLCAGLVIGRLPLDRPKVAVTLAGTGAALAAGAAAVSWLLLNVYGGLAAIWAAQPGSALTVPETTELLNLGGDGTVPASTVWWLAVDGPHTGTTPDLVGTTGAAVALIGVLLLLERLRTASVLLAPLAAAGSMALTFYVAHLAFVNSSYDVYGPGLGYALQVAAVLLVGLAWRATAGKGPLEALVTFLATRAKRWATPRAQPVQAR